MMCVGGQNGGYRFVAAVPHFTPLNPANYGSFITGETPVLLVLFNSYGVYL